jgi:hypothetical protein
VVWIVICISITAHEHFFQSNRAINLFISEVIGCYQNSLFISYNTETQSHRINPGTMLSEIIAACMFSHHYVCVFIFQIALKSHVLWLLALEENNIHLQEAAALNA